MQAGEAAPYASAFYPVALPAAGDSAPFSVRALHLRAGAPTTAKLTLFLDTRVGRHLYGFVEARFDRGFDPRERFAAAHLDAYLGRWTSFDTPLVNP